MVCCDVHLLFRWKSPQVGLLMCAGHPGVLTPCDKAPAVFWKQIVNLSPAWYGRHCFWEQVLPRQPSSPGHIFAWAQELLGPICS